jgi:peptidoglycan/xylan/chitin deacetylase (PgdA/CDA1 family)
VNRIYEAPGTDKDPNAPVVALTFDDGPHPEFTPRILDILKQYGVRATFFELGMNAERYPDVTRRIVAEGHVIGNHTWDHKHLPKLDDEQFAYEIDHTTQVLEQVSGQEIVCTRPPYGDADARIVQKLADRGQASVVWSQDSRDFEKPGADAIVRNALSGLRPGAIILMHDAGGNRDETIAALPRIIEGIRQRGFRIEPVCDARSHKPYGNVERIASDEPERIVARGWTVDPDTTGPTDVHLYVDGAFAAKATAAGPRPDVGRSTGQGDAHGFAFDLPARPGAHRVCLYAINADLGHTNVEIGCRDVKVAEAPWLDRFGRELHLLPDRGRWEDLPTPPAASQALRGLYDTLLPSP